MNQPAGSWPVNQPGGSWPMNQPAGSWPVNQPAGSWPVNQPAGSRRCDWAESSDAMRAYHDTEWGVPSHDDRYLFEMLLLEGAQAGLSWATILNKRDNYRRALDGFDPELIAGYGAAKLTGLMADPGIVRNRLKVAGTVRNAQAFLTTQQQHGSFASYLWSWVDGTPVRNRPRSTADLPAHTPLSDQLSKDLKRRGFTFVGTTIMYSYLQAVGVVNDHLISCPAGGSADEPAGGLADEPAGGLADEPAGGLADEPAGD